MLKRKYSKMAFMMALILSISTIFYFPPKQFINVAQAATVVGTPPVPAYVHPRILITPSELPALKTRLTNSAIGRRSMQSMRTWIDHHVLDATKLKPLYDALVVGDANVLATFPTSYASYLLLVLNYEGFYSMVNDNSVKGAEVSKALISTVRILNGTINNPTLKNAFGAELFNLGYSYDFIYNYMTDAQRTEVRNFFSATTTGKLLPVTTNPDPRINRDNIVPVGTQWALLALAIEGETGYDANVYSQAVQAMNAYFQYGVYDTGAPTEDMHYLNYGMSFGSQTLIAMAKRGDSLFNNPNFQNLKKWYVNSIEPYGYKFTTLGDTPNDLGGLLPNYVLMKWLNPNDPVIDFIWRNRVRDDYTGIKYRNDFLMAAMYGLDWMGGETTEKAPVADDYGVDNNSNPPIVTLKPYSPAALNLPKSFIDSNRGLYITRNEWSQNAMAMQFETNTDSFGPSHTQSNATDFTLTALGQKWAIDRGYHIMESKNHSTILIDGKGQGFFGPYGKTEGVLDADLGTVFVGSAKNAYDYKYTFKGRINNPENQGYTWEFEPKSLWPSSSINSTWRASYNPVQEAFRSAMMIRGINPYVLILDDIQRDANQHSYEWLMQVPSNLEAKSVSSADMILGLVSETPSTPRMLIRSLADSTEPPRVDTFDVKNSSETGSYQNETFGTGKKVVITKQSADPGFKTILFPHNQGSAMPVTTWQGSNLTVNWAGQKDVYSFQNRTDGRTAFGMVRNDGQSFLMVGLTSYSPTAAMSVVADHDGANVLYESNTVTVYGSDWKKLTVNVPGVTQVKVFDNNGAAKDMTGNIQYTQNGVIITEPSVPDTQVPTAPSNLTATAASSNQINLNWTASTDNVGVAGYKVYRGGAEVGTSTTATYSDTGLSASTTYSYTVKAYDTAGNLSAVSNTASAATNSAPVTVFSDNFESGNLNDWTVVNGTWSNVLDGTNHVLKKTTTAEGIIVAGDNWSDIAYTGYVSVPQLSTNAGLIFRYTDINNFYHFRIYNGNVELYKKVGGTMTKVASAPYSAALNQWHILKVIAIGNQIKGYVDNVLQIDWTNSITELASGKIGFRSASPLAIFDDAKVISPPDITPPVLTVPADMKVEAAGVRTFVDIGKAAASDESEVTITNDAPADFPLGTTTVTWTATDDSGNLKTALQKIAVVDITPPQVSVPTNKTVTATAKLTPVTLDNASAVDLVDGPVTVTDDAPLLYPVGSTVVTFTARDSSGNISTAHVTVTVLNAAPVLAPIGNKTVNEGKTLEFFIRAADPNEDSVTYSVYNAPAGAIFDHTVAKFSWTPKFTQSGAYTVVFKAIDDELENSESVTITVLNVSASDLVQENIEYISLHVDTSVKHELSSKLDNVVDSLNKGNKNAAINKLHAFVHSVEAQRGGKITVQQADTLLKSVTTIEYVINLELISY